MAMSPDSLSAGDELPQARFCSSPTSREGFSDGIRRLASSPYTSTINGSGDLGRSSLLRTLVEAEAAASAAAVQLVSFKETLDDDFADSGLMSYSRRATRQRSLLLDKLEGFKQINKSVRRQLTELQESEANRVETQKYSDIVLKKLAQTERENLRLKRELNQTEKRVSELMDLRKKEIESAENVVKMSRSVEATRAHLQGALRNKEAENNRLTVQLRGLERALTESKMECEGLRRELSTLSGRAMHDKEALKKAVRAQKQRAERFEAAVDKCFVQLREKDVQMLEARAERDSWRRQQERSIEERVELDSQIGLLRGQIADVTERLEKERDEVTADNQVLLQKVETLNNDHGELNLDNAALKAAIAGMERQLSSSAAELREENNISQERKIRMEQYQCQVTELTTEVEELRKQVMRLQREAEVKEEKEAEAEKARQRLQGRVQELEGYPGLLRATQQTLSCCQESLQRCEERCADKAIAVSQLQTKMDSQVKKLNSSLEMKESVQEANTHLRERIESLQRRMEELQLENEELVQRLTNQQEALQDSSRHLKQRSAECHTLNRQLEAALADVRQQVTKVREKADSREKALQTKILELEAEKTQRDNEMKQLKHNKLSAEKQFDIRLKDLQLSLERSEKHKQSIQNYVDFLKNSYTIMFDEGVPVPPSSSYFLH